MIRVFLVDDHEIVRCGVADLIDDEHDLVVVGQASSASEAMRRIPAVNPDIAVLDVRLPDGNGIELCRDLRSRCPDLNCLMLTSFTDEQAMLDAIMAGAGGYVIKKIKGMDLVSAIRTVGSGRSLLDNRAAAVLKSRLQATTASSPVAALTAQERTLLELIGQGLTNRQIAGEMFLSEKTVKNYVSRLLGKLGMERRTQAAVLATRLADTHTYRERPSSRGANSQSVGQQDISASAKIGGWPIGRAPKSR
ncbi:response regulator [Mycobacteroides abscessus]|uniref:response regulator n=1 Tax=Mycobacteroides abscessus TaxID=36809 RepID=UPI0005E9E564|nr:response regulator transcription factor [Mycobacteroides abscessus]CPV89468.1 Probable transcriptional regulator%2C LuxR family [Mycobacteroides abscessus]